MKISELLFLYESSGSHGILDLFIEDPRINFAVIPLDKDPYRIHEKTIKQSVNYAILKVFEDKFEGLKKVINQLAAVCYKKKLILLSTFFLNLESLLKLDNFSSYVMKDGGRVLKLLLSLMVAAEEKT